METAEVENAGEHDEVGGIWIVGGVEECGSEAIPKYDKDEMLDAKKFMEERRKMRTGRASARTGICGEFCSRRMRMPSRSARMWSGQADRGPVEEREGFGQAGAEEPHSTDGEEEWRI